MVMLQAFADYHDMMAITEDMIKACANEACGSLQVNSSHSSSMSTLMTCADHAA